MNDTVRELLNAIRPLRAATSGHDLAMIRFYVKPHGFVPCSQEELVAAGQVVYDAWVGLDDAADRVRTALDALPASEPVATAWTDDYDENINTTDPHDGDPPISIWWVDMRRREVCALVHDVYARGLRHASHALITVAHAPVTVPRDVTFADVDSARIAATEAMRKQCIAAVRKVHNMYSNTFESLDHAVTNILAIPAVKKTDPLTGAPDSMDIDLVAIERKRLSVHCFAMARKCSENACAAIDPTSSVMLCGASSAWTEMGEMLEAPVS